jgi:hypothetical protein
MSGPDTDTRDRVIRMETELKELKDDFLEMRKKVDQIHTLMTEARGAQKTIKLLVWISGLGVFTAGFTVWKWVSLKLGIP